jgi:hypothetical protein
VDDLGGAVLQAAVARDLGQPQSQGLLRRVLAQQLGRQVDEALDVMLVDLHDQRLAGREVPVEGPDPDPGELGELGHRRELSRAERLPSGRHDPLAVARRGGPGCAAWS